MNSFPFWALIPIVAIIASAVVGVVNTRARRYTSSSELAKRVEELERRVASIGRHP